MDLYRNEMLCCGCFACESVCPRNAIQMQPDKKGFMVPIIDESTCINCGICLKVCPLQNKCNIGFKEPKAVYAAINKNDLIRQRSRSGGVFMALAEWTISKHGIVYGAAMTADLSVRHIRANDLNSCKLFQGSKYVQSNLFNTFSQVKDDLNEEKTVLYSGTGCQIAGLLSYLKVKNVDVSNLYTCDLVCHGNVSPKMYEDYRKYYENKYGGKITEFNFRDKSVGWNTHIESFVINDKKYIRRGYTELYYSNAAYRESCYSCPYARKERIGDFTLADCWGAESKLGDMFDNRGISLVLVNSQKALSVFNNIADQLDYRAVVYDDFMQPQLKNPVKKSNQYEIFWDLYQDRGFKYILKTFGKQNSVDTIKRWVRQKILKKY